VSDTVRFHTLKHTESILTAQAITVKITDWALAAGTKTPSAQHTGMENLANNTVKCEEFCDDTFTKSAVPKMTPPSQASTLDHPPWSTYTAKYAVYSAAVSIHLTSGLRLGLHTMTKKYPPPHFDFEAVYVSLPSAVVVHPTLMTNAVLQKGV
jgi:hypothetical protein